MSRLNTTSSPAYPRTTQASPRHTATTSTAPCTSTAEGDHEVMGRAGPLGVESEAVLWYPVNYDGTRTMEWRFFSKGQAAAVRLAIERRYGEALEVYKGWDPCWLQGNMGLLPWKLNQEQAWRRAWANVKQSLKPRVKRRLKPRVKGSETHASVLQRVHDDSKARMFGQEAVMRQLLYRPAISPEMVVVGSGTTKGGYTVMPGDTDSKSSQVSEKLRECNAELVCSQVE